MEFEKVKNGSSMAELMTCYFRQRRYESIGLEDAYKKSSHAKKIIYQYWKAFAYNTDLGCTIFSIAGHNCMTFSLIFDIVHRDGSVSLYYITKSHNYRLDVDKA